MVNLNPHISLRELERDLGVPYSTTRRILKRFKFHPYHITLTQQISDADMIKRVDFCRWAQTIILDDVNFFKYVMFSDEATFHSTGQLNRHNSHYWSVENPHWSRSVDHQHRWSINVWCGIINGYLVGPFVIDGILNGLRYLAFLRNDLPLLMEDVDLETSGQMWLQQDGAPPHSH